MVRLLTLLMIGLLTGCGCTLVGCKNEVRFAVGSDLVPEVNYQVEACFDDACERGTLRVASGESIDSDGAIELASDMDEIWVSLPDGDFGASHRVRLTVTDELDAIVEFDQQVEMGRVEPNGGWPCGPTCWQADLEV